MMDLGVGEVGNVNVVTTNNAGLPIEHWAERATNTIVFNRKLSSFLVQGA